MLGQLRSGWIPLGSFALALVLSAVAGPSSRALGLRGPSEMTGGCKHSPYVNPETSTGEVCTIDGATTFLRLTPQSFNPFRRLDFNNEAQCVSKAQDASLCLDARVEFGHGSATAQGTTSANLGHAFTEGDLSQCCHLAELEASGILVGRLRTHGAFPVGTSALAVVGTETAPMTVRCKVTYDDDCNLVEEARQEKATIVSVLSTHRDVKSLPAHSLAVASIRVDTTDFTETEAVELPPRIDTILLNEDHAGGLTVRLNAGSVGPRVIKSFRKRTVAEIETSGSAIAIVSGTGRFLPLAAADISFDVKHFQSLDITESSLAELTK